MKNHLSKRRFSQKNNNNNKIKKIKMRNKSSLQEMIFTK